MDTVIAGFAETCPVLFGSNSFSAFGFTSVEVIRKKMSSRNTRSVIEDIAVSDSTFVDLLNISTSPPRCLPARAEDP